MRNIRILAFLAVAFAATGCLRATYTLNLKPDGSGTITSLTAVSQQGGMFGAQAGAAMPTEAELRAQAAAMGQGVRFVSSAPYKADGFEGVTAVFAFDDVNTLTLNLEQALASETDDLDPDADIKLSFSREGGRSVLVIGMPAVPTPDETQKDQADQVAKQAEASPQLDAMMQQLLKGALLEVVVNVDGTIVTTNAPFVEGPRVVLLRLDGNELAKSGMGASQLMRMGQNPDMQAMLREVPGLKIVTLPEVRIEFR
jgi:hypothetical protein